jgi:cold shock CspA family protein
MGIMDNMFGKKVIDDKEYELEDGKSPKYEGKVIYVSDKGWGFVTTRDIPFTKIFFHWTFIDKDQKNFTEWKKGDKVEFYTRSVEGMGLQAINIKQIGEKS